MTDDPEQRTYEILWQSHIDSDPSRLRQDKFVGVTSAVRFIESLERSRNRTFVRCMPALEED